MTVTLQNGLGVHSVFSLLVLSQHQYAYNLHVLFLGSFLRKTRNRGNQELNLVFLPADFQSLLPSLPLLDLCPSSEPMNTLLLKLSKGKVMEVRLIGGHSEYSCMNFYMVKPLLKGQETVLRFSM
jgi:hypothetical protein